MSTTLAARCQASARRASERRGIDARVLGALRRHGGELYAAEVAERLGLQWARDLRRVQSALRRIEAAKGATSRLDDGIARRGHPRRYYRAAAP